MITAHEIRNEIRNAGAINCNVYCRPIREASRLLWCGGTGHGFRITRARRYCDQTQVFALATGEWYTLQPGDMLYAQ